jgi:biopolymer transport protein ExbD
MAFGSFNEGGGTQPMSEINTTPLVDVMLVLLVIFIITAPLFHQAVQVDLPRVDSSKLDNKPAVIHVALDGQGQIFLDGAPITRDQLDTHFAQAMQTGDGAPELHLRADRDTRYEQVAEIMAAAQRAGIVKIAFVTQTPQP